MKLKKYKLDLCISTHVIHIDQKVLIIKLEFLETETTILKYFNYDIFLREELLYVKLNIIGLIRNILLYDKSYISSFRNINKNSG
jgi:hypothetical protein